MTDDPSMMVEHLKMVQGVVARMSGNSAQMKTWAVSLVTGTLAFSGLSDNPHWLIGVGGCVSVVAFWMMDARYLHLERCYIKLYEAVVAGESGKLFDLNYRPHVSTVRSVWKVAWSWSIFRFYGTLLFMMLFLLVFLSTGSPQWHGEFSTVSITHQIAGELAKSATLV